MAPSYHGAQKKGFPLPPDRRKMVEAGGDGASPMTARKVGEHVELDQEEARAGQTGNHVRYILAIGVVLVVIGFVLLGGVWFGG
jgi:hypothetical protein